MNKRHLIYLALAFATITILTRLIPHPWNFAPMGSFVLFSGFLLPRKWLWLPLLSLAISDAIIGTYQFGVMATVYSAYALMLGVSYANRRHYSLPTALGGSIAASVVFFATTNAGVWAFSGMYSPDFSGLMASYVAGIPFFRNSFAGYLAYSAVFFGAYELARFRVMAHTASISKKAESAITGIVM